MAKSSRKYTHVLSPSQLPHLLSLSHHQHPAQSGTLWQGEDLYWRVTVTQHPPSALAFPLRVVCSIGFDKYVMGCIYQWSLFLFIHKDPSTSRRNFSPSVPFWLCEVKFVLKKKTPRQMLCSLPLSISLQNNESFLSGILSSKHTLLFFVFTVTMTRTSCHLICLNALL